MVCPNFVGLSTFGHTGLVPRRLNLSAMPVTVKISMNSHIFLDNEKLSNLSFCSNFVGLLYIQSLFEALSQLCWAVIHILCLRLCPNFVGLLCIVSV